MKRITMIWHDSPATAAIVITQMRAAKIAKVFHIEAGLYCNVNCHGSVTP